MVLIASIVPEQLKSISDRYSAGAEVVSASATQGAVMSAKDHPNNAPGVPMLFPVWFERFQLKYLNRAVKPIAPAATTALNTCVNT